MYREVCLSMGAGARTLQRVPCRGWRGLAHLPPARKRWSQSHLWRAYRVPVWRPVLWASLPSSPRWHQGCTPQQVRGAALAATSGRRTERRPKRHSPPRVRARAIRANCRGFQPLRSCAGHLRPRVGRTQQHRDSIEEMNTMAQQSRAKRIERQIAQETGAHVVVAESNGALLLSGAVPTGEDRARAATIAASLAGGLRIENGLEVRRLVAEGREDTA